MSTELTLLAWAVALGLAQAMATGLLTIAQHGVGYGLSSRDEQKPMTGVPARVTRAFANYMQTFPFFAAAVLVAHVAGRHSGTTVLGAHLYFWSRLVFPFLYAFNVIVVRTAAFGISLAGIVLILLGLV